jgi:hypothetical protein
MSSNNGDKLPAEGAVTPVMLALGLPDHGPSGRFFRDEVEVEW